MSNNHQLFKDLILNGGSDMIDFNKLSDIVLEKAKNKEDIFNIIVNEILGGLNKNDENNENIKKLMKITISKYIKNNNFSKNENKYKNSKKTQYKNPNLELVITEKIPKKQEKERKKSEKKDKKPNNFVSMMSKMIYETMK